MFRDLTFDDVLLKPQRSEIRSRDEIDLSAELDKNHQFKIPIISSPMDTISEDKMADAMSQAGGFSIIHRYCTIDRQINLVDFCKEETVLAAAVGVNGDYLERAQALVDEGVSIICIDVAHGHHILVKEALETLRKELGDNIHLMAGNVATITGFRDLQDWGADSIRVGIGSGAICSTRIQTGHGVPQLTAIQECARAKLTLPGPIENWKLNKKAKLIADGGIRKAGDAVKALAAGADFIMCGSMFAGTDETPGNVIHLIKGKHTKFKVYRGQASQEAQKDWRNKSYAPEGISTTVPCSGPVAAILNDFVRHLKSGLSYSAARNIKELQKKAVFIEQTAAGRIESGTHILEKACD
jgi:IMP dehydrogenase